MKRIHLFWPAALALAIPALSCSPRKFNQAKESSFLDRVPDLPESDLVPIFQKAKFVTEIKLGQSSLPDSLMDKTCIWTNATSKNFGSREKNAYLRNPLLLAVAPCSDLSVSKMDSSQSRADIIDVIVNTKNREPKYDVEKHGIVSSSGFYAKAEFWDAGNKRFLSKSKIVSGTVKGGLCGFPHVAIHSGGVDGGPLSIYAIQNRDLSTCEEDGKAAASIPLAQKAWLKLGEIEVTNDQLTLKALCTGEYAKTCALAVSQDVFPKTKKETAVNLAHAVTLLRAPEGKELTLEPWMEYDPGTGFGCSGKGGC